MNDAIWKYELDITDDPQCIEMPSAAEIVHVDAQAGRRLCMWARVTPIHAPVERWFTVAGTGYPIGGEYHGTALMSDGFVWHVFEIDAP